MFWVDNVITQTFTFTDTKSTQWVDPRLELKNKPTAVSNVIEH